MVRYAQGLAQGPAWRSTQKMVTRRESARNASTVPSLETGSSGSLCPLRAGRVHICTVNARRSFSLITVFVLRVNADLGAGIFINVEQKNEKGFLCSVSFEMPVEAAPGTICLGQPENQPQAEGMWSLGLLEGHSEFLSRLRSRGVQETSRRISVRQQKR